MKPLTAQHCKIGAALLAIFLSGQGLGFVFASLVDNGITPAPSEIAVPSPPPESWADDALNRLRSDLDLTPSQEGALRPILDGTGTNIVRQRERALFQIHLQLLAAHDDMAGLLNPDQQAKLKASRDSLRRRIDERFAAFLDDGAPGVLD